MNQGTSSCRAGSLRASGCEAPGSATPSSRRCRATNDRHNTTGPSISTRTSFTTVPTWLLSAPMGNVCSQHLRNRVNR